MAVTTTPMQQTEVLVTNTTTKPAATANTDEESKKRQAEIAARNEALQRAAKYNPQLTAVNSNTFMGQSSAAITASGMTTEQLNKYADQMSEAEYRKGMQGYTLMRAYKPQLDKIHAEKDQEQLSWTKEEVDIQNRYDAASKDFFKCDETTRHQIINKYDIMERKQQEEQKSKTPQIAEAEKIDAEAPLQTPETPKDAPATDAETPLASEDKTNTDKSGSTEDEHQPDEKSKENEFPYVGDSLTRIWAMPPVMSDPKDHSGGIAGDDDGLYSIFENSFPILTMAPVDLSKPEHSGNVKEVNLIGPIYKFAVTNDGNGTGYSISNEYGSSMIEDGFKEFSQSNMISELWQIAKSNRNAANALNKGRDALYRWTKGASEKMWNDVKADTVDSLKSFDAGAAETIFKPIVNMGQALIDGIIMGRKIDIPNIWKGSSSQIQQQVKIVLHCTEPHIDEAYEWRILKPLEILLRLGLPYSTSSKKGYSQGHEDTTNDIITYQNPPYLRAELDGLFKSELCGISNLAIDIPFQGQSLVKGGRPTIVNVSLTLTDMYDAIIWTDQEAGVYSPHGKGIIEQLRNHNRDSLINPISENFKYSWIPQTGTSLSYGGDSEDESWLSKAWRIGTGIASTMTDPDAQIIDKAQKSQEKREAEMKATLGVGQQVPIGYGMGSIWEQSADVTFDTFWNGGYTDAATKYATQIYTTAQVEEVNKQPVTKLPENYGGMSF